MRLSIIAALSTNNVIGRRNELPWRLSADLKRFKALTMGHHLLLGRKTFESIGRPLAGRTMVVLTRGSIATSGVLTATSIEEALALAAHDEEPFVAGGADLYAQTIRRAGRMYLTRVHAEIEGDATFPEFDDVNEWRLVDSEHFEADAKNEYPFSFLTYDRVARERPAGEFEESG
jgi:dihydrofolate reductase